ncbi:MAG TPA: sugar ABC transporter ATP-binding protein, partial [Paracoccaceae bacterium]|nr:sugar ABC transporter ATP-binding protein [Paracoccaceae bacterium]
SNLDAKLRVDMRTEIKKLHQRLGVTIVYVTHDQIEAMTLSTRIAVMFAGRVQQLGSPKEIYDRPANLFVAGFMGSPSMNLFPATVAIENGVPLALFRLVDGSEARLPFADSTLAAAEGRDIILGIRPEAITDPEGADRKSHAIHLIEAPVEVTEPAGSDTFVVTHMGGKEITARFRADADVKAGGRARFAVNMEKAVAFDPKTEMRIG